MANPQLIQQIAQAVVARLLPHIQTGNGATPTLKRSFTVKECAEYVGRSDIAIYRLVAKRQIPCVRSGRTVRFLRDDIDKWLEGDRA